MILRKFKLTYLFWGLLLIFLLEDFICVGMNGQYLFSGLPIDGSIAGFGFVALCIVFAEVLSVLAKKFNKTQRRNQLNIGAFFEFVLLFFVLFFSFLGSFIFTVTVEFPKDFYDHGLSYWDLECSKLDFLLFKLADLIKFASDSEVARVLYVNVAVFLIATVILYFTIKKLMGLVSAIVSIVMFSALNLGGIGYGALSAFLIAVSILFIIIPKWSAVNNKCSHQKVIFWLILAGLISGFSIYAEISNIGLLLFALVVFSVYKDDPMVESSNRGKSIVYILSSIVGYYIGFNVFKTLGMWSNSYKFIDDISRTGNIIEAVFDSPSMIQFDMLSGHPLVIAVALTLGMVWCIRIYSIERDHGSYMIIVPFIAYVLYSIGIYNSGNCYGAINYFLAIFAAMGFVSLGKNSLEYLEREKLEKERYAREKAEKIASAKKELEEKKKMMAEKEKNMMRKNKESDSKKNNSIELNYTSSDAQDIKSLEASLEFLHKPAEEKKSEAETDKENTQEKVDESGEVSIETPDNNTFILNTNTSITSDSDENLNSAVDETEGDKVKNESSVIFPEQYASEKPPLKVAPIEINKEEKRYVSMSSPSSKFARRMDYKTAIVKPGNQVLDNTANTANNSNVENITITNNSIAENSIAENSIITGNSIITESDTTKANIANKNLAANVNSETKVNVLDVDKNANSDIALDFLKEKADEEVSDDNVEPDLMSVNIIESRDEDISEAGVENNANVNKDLADDSSVKSINGSIEGAIESGIESGIEGSVKDSIASSSVDLTDNTKEDNKLADNVLDLKALNKEEEIETPAPAPKPTPVSASEPVLKSVVAQKPPILGKGTEPVNKIHNPLPTPKKHVNKAQEFDIDPADVDMHFDIVDLAGKDFFDIN